MQVFPDSNLHVLRLLQPLVDVACGMQDFVTAENAGRRIAKVYETLLPKCHPLKGLQVSFRRRKTLIWGAPTTFVASDQEFQWVC